MSENPVTLVLIPGLLSDDIVWEHAKAHFEKTMPVSIPDLFTQDSIHQMAVDVLEQNPGQLAVAGHSMGARVAFDMIALAPERIERVALLDTGFHPLGENEMPVREELIKLAHDDGMEALLARWLPPMVHPSRLEDPAIMKPLTDMVLRRNAEIHERQVRALIGRRDAGKMLATINCPTLVAVGRQDGFSPVSQHEDIAEMIPNAKLVIFEDAGHFAPFERPEIVTAALAEWLSGD